MSNEQREFLAGLLWESLYQKRTVTVTAKEADKSPRWLGEMVRRGWVSSYQWRRDAPRRWMLTREGFMALVGVEVKSR